MRFLCAALLVIAGTGTAAADIRINTSRYANGALTIAGQTEPDKTVVLDGKYKTKSDAEGDFKFTEHYKPDTCMSDIRAGSSDYGAVIAGCFDTGAGNDTLPEAAPPVKKASAEPKR